MTRALELALRQARKTRADKLAAGQSFCDFATLTGIKLTPAQLELARVAFDGRPATDDRLWGFGGKALAARVRRVVAAVCGRGSGKSLLGGLRVLHLAMTVRLGGLQASEDALCPVVAPDLKAARHTVRFAAGVARQLFPDLIVKDTGDGFTLRRDREVRIEARAASTGGTSIRASGYPCAVLDESAFFRDSSYKVNDQEIYDAIWPRLMPGGQIVILSSPWAELGMLWEFWRDNWGKPTTALVAHAPTLLMREGGPEYENVREIVEDGYRLDPIKAEREFGAKFMSAGSGQYFDARAIEGMVDETLPLEVPHDANATVAVCADYGFARDCSALVIVQRIGEQYFVSLVDEVVPSDTPLIPSSVVRRFAGHTRRYKADSQAADAHYREAIREHLEAEDVALTNLPEGAGGKAEMYALARALIHQGQVKAPRHGRLFRQLREVIGKPTSGGQLSIQSPRWATGGHGDLASALVGALWLANRLGWQEPEKPSTMDELEQREVERWQQESKQDWVERMLPQ